MHLLDKINSWVQSGPMGNDKQDPLLITAAVLGGAKTIGGWMDEANEKKARDNFLDELANIGGEIKGKADEFFDIADDYLPGGSFWNQAQQQAIDTSFTAAQKGQETAMASGINLSSYGTGVMQDVIKDDYTSNFVEDYKDFASIGLQYAGVGQSLYNQYADITTSALQTDYMGQASQTSTMTDLADMGMDIASSYFAGGGKLG